MSSELKDFLIHKRGRITPLSAGLNPDRRRRTAGLTREDMAELTGVSFKWYTLFESGSDKGVSRKFAERVADALDLTSAERHYLLGLLGFSHRPAASGGPPVAPPGLRRLVRAERQSPTALYSSMYEVLDCNDRYSQLFPRPDTSQPLGNNKLWRLFLESDYRAVWDDWEAVARRVITRFRPLTSHLHESPEYGTLLAALDKSPDFRRVWNDTDTQGSPPPGSDVSIILANGARARFEVVALQSTEAEGVYLMSFLPADSNPRPPALA